MGNTENFAIAPEDHTFQEEMEPIRPQVTHEIAMDSERELSAFDTTTNSVSNLISNYITERDQEARGVEKLDPKTLNDMFPDMEKPFNEPMTESQAALTADRNRDRQRLQRLANSGPLQDEFSWGRFGNGMVPHLLDPVDFALGLGVGKVLGVAGRGAKWGAAFSKRGTKLQRFGGDVVEGVIGNAAAEPFVYLSNKQDLSEYTAEEAFFNTIAGAVAIPAAKGAFDLTAKGLSKMPRMWQKGMATATKQLDGGRKIDLDAYPGDRAKELGGTPSAEGPEVPIAERKIYVGSEVNTKDVTMAKTAPMSKDYGDGLYATSKEEVANNMATSKYSENDAGGSVIEARFTEGSNIIDGDLEPSSGIRTNFVDEFEVEHKPGETLSEYMDRVIDGDTERAMRVHSILEDHNIDAVSYTANDFNGVKHEPNRQHYIVNNESVVPERSKSADKTRTTGLSTNEMNAVREKQSSIEADSHYNPETMKAVEKNLQEQPSLVDRRQLDNDIAELEAELSEAQRNGFIEESEVKEIRELIEAEKARIEKEDRYTKGLMTCFNT